MDRSRGLPNVLLISLDAVRADHLSCYGYDRITCPFLDRFASEAVLYEYAYTAARWTLPAHASLFTGMSNSKHGISTDWTNLRALEDPQVVTVAEFLKGLGYETAAFSSIEWIGPKTRLDRGFDHFGQAWTLLDPSDKMYHKLKRMSKAVGKNPIPRLNRYYETCRADKGAGKINRMFRRWLRSTSPERPFFAFLHFLEAHAKYWPPEPYRSAFVSADFKAKQVAETHIGPWLHLTGKKPISQEELVLLSRLYDGALLYLDHILKEVIGFLGDRDLLDNTLVIITSDHGECFGEHGYYQHSSPTLHESAIRVPLIVRYPACHFAGERIATPVSVVDIFPTIIDLLPADASMVSEQLQGASLVPLGGEFDRGRIVITESLTTPEGNLLKVDPQFDIARFDYLLRAVRWQDYKYVWSSQGDHKLYDLSVDSHEERNLVTAEPTLARTMQESLDEWLASFASSTMQSGSEEELDPEVRRRLAGLGYVDAG